MNTIDSRLRHTRAHLADTDDRRHRLPSPSRLVEKFLHVGAGLLGTARAWIRDLDRSTHLGPDADQVTGRGTGVRT